MVSPPRHDADMGLLGYLAAMRASAVNCLDAAMAGEVYWREKIKPALLYDAQVIPYTMEYIRKLEVAQNKAGR